MTIDDGARLERNAPDRSPRLLAVDLDGTLLRDDDTLSVRTREALRRADEDGLAVVVVTGRSVMTVDDLSDELGRSGVAICSNGAVVYDLSTRTIIAEETVPPEVGGAVVAALRAALPEAIFAVDEGVRFACEAEWTVREHMAPRVARRAVAEELVVRPVTKILARVDAADPDALLAIARAAIGDLATVTTSTGWGLVEVGARDVSKGTALRRLATARGIEPADAVAVGDMPNDIPMLRWAGTAAAVANAHDDVLALADLVTASNEDDGVADLIDACLVARGTGRPVTATVTRRE